MIDFAVRTIAVVDGFWYDLVQPRSAQGLGSRIEVKTDYAKSASKQGIVESKEREKKGNEVISLAAEHDVYNVLLGVNGMGGQQMNRTGGGMRTIESE